MQKKVYKKSKGLLIWLSLLILAMIGAVLLGMHMRAENILVYGDMVIGSTYAGSVGAPVLFGFINPLIDWLNGLDTWMMFSVIAGAAVVSMLVLVLLVMLLVKIFSGGDKYNAADGSYDIRMDSGRASNMDIRDDQGFLLNQGIGEYRPNLGRIEERYTPDINAHIHQLPHAVRGNQFIAGHAYGSLSQNVVDRLGFDINSPIMPNSPSFDVSDPESVKKKISWLQREAEEIVYRLQRVSDEHINLRAYFDNSILEAERTILSTQDEIAYLEEYLHKVPRKEKQQVLAEMDEKDALLQHTHNLIVELTDENNGLVADINALSNAEQALIEAKRASDMALVKAMADEQVIRARYELDAPMRKKLEEEGRAKLRKIMIEANKLILEDDIIDAAIDKRNQEKERLQTESASIQQALFSSDNVDEVGKLSQSIHSNNLAVIEIDRLNSIDMRNKSYRPQSLSKLKRDANDIIEDIGLDLDGVVKMEDIVLEEVAMVTLRKDVEDSRRTAQEEVVRAQHAHDRLVGDYERELTEISHQTALKMRDVELRVEECTKLVGEISARIAVAREDEATALNVEKLVAESNLTAAKTAVEKVRAQSMRERIESKALLDKQIVDASKRVERSKKEYENILENQRRIEQDPDITRIVPGSGAISKVRRQLEEDNAAVETERRHAKEQFEARTAEIHREKQRLQSETQSAFQFSNAMQEDIALAQNGDAAAKSRVEQIITSGMSGEEIEYFYSMRKEEQWRFIMMEIEERTRQAQFTSKDRLSILIAEEEALRAKYEAEERSRQAQEEIEKAKRFAEEQVMQSQLEMDFVRMQALDSVSIAREQAEKQAEEITRLADEDRKKAALMVEEVKQRVEEARKQAEEIINNAKLHSTQPTQHHTGSVAVDTAHTRLSQPPVFSTEVAQSQGSSVLKERKEEIERELTMMHTKGALVQEDKDRIAVLLKTQGEVIRQIENERKKLLEQEFWGAGVARQRQIEHELSAIEESRRRLDQEQEKADFEREMLEQQIREEGDNRRRTLEKEYKHIESLRRELLEESLRQEEETIRRQAEFEKVRLEEERRILYEAELAKLEQARKEIEEWGHASILEKQRQLELEQQRIEEERRARYEAELQRMERVRIELEEQGHASALEKQRQLEEVLRREEESRLLQVEYEKLRLEQERETLLKEELAKLEQARKEIEEWGQNSVLEKQRQLELEQQRIEEERRARYEVEMQQIENARKELEEQRQAIVLEQQRRVEEGLRFEEEKAQLQSLEEEQRRQRAEEERRQHIEDERRAQFEMEMLKLEAARREIEEQKYASEAERYRIAEEQRLLEEGLRQEEELRRQHNEQEKLRIEEERKALFDVEMQKLELARFEIEQLRHAEQQRQTEQQRQMEETLRIVEENRRRQLEEEAQRLDESRRAQFEEEVRKLEALRQSIEDQKFAEEARIAEKERLAVEHQQIQQENNSKEQQRQERFEAEMKQQFEIEMKQILDAQKQFLEEERKQAEAVLSEQLRMTEQRAREEIEEARRRAEEIESKARLQVDAASEYARLTAEEATAMAAKQAQDAIEEAARTRAMVEQEMLSIKQQLEETNIAKIKSEETHSWEAQQALLRAEQAELSAKLQAEDAAQEVRRLAEEAVTQANKQVQVANEMADNVRNQTNEEVNRLQREIEAIRHARNEEAENIRKSVEQETRGRQEREKRIADKVAQRKLELSNVRDTFSSIKNELDLRLAIDRINSISMLLDEEEKSSQELRDAIARTTTEAQQAGELALLKEKLEEVSAAASAAKEQQVVRRPVKRAPLPPMRAMRRPMRAMRRPMRSGMRRGGAVRRVRSGGGYGTARSSMIRTGVRRRRP